MTHFTIYSWLIVLMVSNHGILMIEGRRLKSTEKQELYHNKERNTLNVNQQLQESAADGVPSGMLPVAEKKAAFPPKVVGQNQGYVIPEGVNDFRPTTPGNSPGAGHSFTEHGYDKQSTVPTGPGHSPGGGHSKQNQVVKPNA